MLSVIENWRFASEFARYGHILKNLLMFYCQSLYSISCYVKITTSKYRNPFASF